jgi:menaquinone-specific isochorismate synthase
LHPYRSAPSLSFAEPRQRALIQAWVDRSISEGLSDARGNGASLLHVNTRKLDWELPLGMFDSSVEDVHFLGTRDRAVLGIGVAKVIQPGSRKSLLGKDDLSTANASKVIAMGGWGFPEAGGQKGIWSDFPSSRWVIPALTLTSGGGGARITLVVEVGRASKAAPLRALYRKLARSLEVSATNGPERPDAGAGAIPRLKRARSMPSRGRWESLAQSAIDSISAGKMKKVVLARGVALDFSAKVLPSVVLRRLIAFNPDSTVFAIKRRGSVFLGATPESLVSVRGARVEVDCLAASSPRDGDVSTDEALGARLLGDAKSSREHQLVVQAAVTALSPLSSRVEVPAAPVLKKLTTIQHLYTPVKATLRDGEDVWTAARALWPNPAIGGEPREEAVRWIRKFERVNRGWYSGVVGLVNASQDEADLVVGIRSGVIKGRQAVVYAGAGLVAGSEPRTEFEETGWKLRTMSRALGVDAAGGG